MRVGIIVYSDMTEIEPIAIHECLSKVAQFGMPNAPECHIVGLTPEVVGWNGLVIKPHRVFSQVDLAEFACLVVPGGLASRAVRYDAPFMTWLKTWDRAKPIASVCSGALILAEAGFLKGKKATTHVLAMGALGAYGVEVVKRRIVDEGNVITAGGLMAAFDLGLHLVERFWGAEARRVVAHQDEYRDLEKHPHAAALKTEMDTWYNGGHQRTNLRPANWFALPPDDGVDRTTIDYHQVRK